VNTRTKTDQARGLYAAATAAILATLLTLATACMGSNGDVLPSEQPPTEVPLPPLATAVPPPEPPTPVLETNQADAPNDAADDLETRLDEIARAMEERREELQNSRTRAEDRGTTPPVTSRSAELESDAGTKHTVPQSSLATTVAEALRNATATPEPTATPKPTATALPTATTAPTPTTPPPATRRPTPTAIPTQVPPTPGPTPTPTRVPRELETYVSETLGFEIKAPTRWVSWTEDERMTIASDLEDETRITVQRYDVSKGTSLAGFADGYIQRELLSKAGDWTTYSQQSAYGTYSNGQNVIRVSFLRQIDLGSCRENARVQLARSRLHPAKESGYAVTISICRGNEELDSTDAIAIMESFTEPG